MAKKKGRKSRKSLGIHGTTRVGRSTSVLANMERLNRQLDASIAGKRTRVSISGYKAVEGKMLFPKVDK